MSKKQVSLISFGARVTARENGRMDGPPSINRDIKIACAAGPCRQNRLQLQADKVFRLSTAAGTIGGRQPQLDLRDAAAGSRNPCQKR